MVTTYKQAGVDIDAGAELVRRIAPLARSTETGYSITDIGGFAGLTAIPNSFREPVLVSGTDGVGTKLELLAERGDFETAGIDLVAMCVNDIIVSGAEPLLFLDYYATGELDVDAAEKVVSGIAEGCRMASCSLAGGETAEMPGFYDHGRFDLAGFAVGVVERSEIIDGSAIQPGDALVGLASSGAHANGFSLIRKVIKTSDELPESVINQLLAPTRIYARSIQAVKRKVNIRGMAHITGGGLTENIPRMLPEGMQALLRPANWRMQKAFSELQAAGKIADAEMRRVFNCGMGFVIAVASAEAPDLISALVEVGERAFVCGRVEEGSSGEVGFIG
ncbi:MAG: phosphoribosylformylglycinamidine cyclo-ligase [Gammaproteobacteria bacterium]|nr:phosphoribosylformylglycinamidine cyclo-ligase [Gammaproteobacteria bacterium]